MPITTRLIQASAILLALALLGLQILGGLEYTNGGSLYTRASMIAAMVTLAAMPLFIEAARHFRARLYAIALGIAFACLLAYSLPAVVGRTGELKESKAAAAADARLDTIRWRNDLRGIEKTLLAASADMLTECASAPKPLPEAGWPKCRRKQGTVSALTAKKAELDCKLGGGQPETVLGELRCKLPLDGESPKAIGDVGSETWAWALAPVAAAFGTKIEPPTIRRGSAIGFAVGLDFAIWSLLGFAAHLSRTTSTAGTPRLPPPTDGGRLIEEQPKLELVDAAQSSDAAAATAGTLTAPSQPSLASLDADSLAVLAALARAKGPVNNGELAALMGVEKAEASKRASAAEAAGVITRTRSGREVLISSSAVA